ncbi:MAG TPA: FHA domain-containing protein, partial [Holophaga sp.]|nr:FHA domain-containing protein [Holophaga sp.]
MKISLLVEGTRHVVDLTERGITIGRGDAATIQVVSNAVSRIHARIFLKDGMPCILDLKSLNGTTLNGQLLRGPAPLRMGDDVRMGEISVQWVEEPADGPDPQITTGSMPALVPRISLEDRAFDASGSILVPHASLEAMLARHRAEALADSDNLFQRLASMAGKLLRAAGLRDLLESVMALITAQIRCQRGFILLVDPSGELVPECGWEEQPGAITTPISRTIARTAMQDRVAILTTDARVDPRFAAGESIRIHGITSA